MAGTDSQILKNWVKKSGIADAVEELEKKDELG